jgi:chromosome segregation ATPase
VRTDKGQTLRKIKAHLSSLDRENLTLQDENRVLAKQLRHMAAERDQLARQETHNDSSSAALSEKLARAKAEFENKLADTEADKVAATHALRQQCAELQNKLVRMESALERERDSKRERHELKRESARRERERMERQMNGLLAQMATSGDDDAEAATGQRGPLAATVTGIANDNNNNESSDDGGAELSDSHGHGPVVGNVGAPQ